MAGNGNTDFAACHLLDLVRDLVGNGRIRIILHFLSVFLLGKLCVFLGNGAFCDGNDGKAAAALVSAFDGFHDLVDVIGDLGEQDHVRAASDARVQRKPAHLVAHDLDDENTAVRAGRCMDLVDSRSGNVDCRLEAEGHLRSPEVIVNGLGKGDHIQAFLAEQVGCLGGAVSAAHDQAVQLQLVIGLFHGLYLVDAVLVRNADGLEGAAACAQDRAASGQYTLEISSGQDPEFPVDQALIAIFKAIKFNRFLGVVDNTLVYAAKGRIQGLAVAAACQHTDS